MTDQPLPQPIGRQPEIRAITPSARQPWYGRWVGDNRFTQAQHAALINRNIDIPTAEFIEVRREATDREMWWPLRSPPPVFAFDCPIVGRRADGRLDIIAPSGERTVVLANGWVRMPRHRGNAHLAAPLPKAASVAAPRRQARPNPPIVEADAGQPASTRPVFVPARRRSRS